MLIGEAGSGKTTFCKKSLTGLFEERYIPTLGVEVYPIFGANYFDTAGQDKFGGLRGGYSIGADRAYFFIPACSKPRSKSLDYWITEFRRECSNLEIIVVISKMDIKNDEYIELIKQYASERRLQYMFYSAKW